MTSLVLEKQLLPILVKVAGRERLVIGLFWNAPSPILVTDGMVTEVRFGQELKACSPILVTDGIVTEVRFGQE